MSCKNSADLHRVISECARKILSSTDKELISKTAAFWASAVDVFLQDWEKSSQLLDTQADLETRELMASRLAQVGLELLLFFGAQQGSEEGFQARLAASESITAMVDRQVEKLWNKAEKRLS